VKKAWAIVMLFCLLFMMTGFRAIFRLRRAEIKSQVRRSIRNRKSNEGLVEFSFNLNNKEQLSRIEWEDGHEFRFNGHMYDVVEKTVTGNRMVLLCLPDTREEALVRAYEKMNEEQNGPPHSASFSLFKLLRSLFAPPGSHGAPPLSAEKPPLSSRYLYYFSSLYRPVQTPPPRIAAA
jgi:hypothetical protein